MEEADLFFSLNVNKSHFTSFHPKGFFSSSELDEKRIQGSKANPESFDLVMDQSNSFITGTDFNTSAQSICWYHCCVCIYKTCEPHRAARRVGEKQKIFLQVWKMFWKRLLQSVRCEKLTSVLLDRQQAERQQVFNILSEISSHYFKAASSIVVLS